MLSIVWKGRIWSGIWKKRTHGISGGEYELIKDYNDAAGLSYQRNNPRLTFHGLFPVEVEYLQIFDDAKKDWEQRKMNAPFPTAILSGLGWFICWHSPDDIASRKALLVGSAMYGLVFLFTAVIILLRNSGAVKGGG